MRGYFWEYVGIAGFLALALAAGLWLGEWLAPKPVIGVVRFETVIDFASAEHLVNVLERAKQDESVAGVVLEINSPGGFAISSETLYYSLLELRKVKPIISVVDGIAASGGYYMAAATNRIYTAPASYLANVGTRGGRPFDPFFAPGEMSTGPFKLSGGSRFDFIRQLDLMRNAFVDNVMQQRENAEVNPIQIDAAVLGEARIYIGSEAVGLGLADAIGGRSDAVMAAAELAGVEKYEVVNLLDHLAIEPLQSFPSFEASVQQMVENAPPGMVYFVDSRMPLPGLVEASAIEDQLLRLRAATPGLLGESQQLQLFRELDRLDAAQDAAELTTTTVTGGISR